MTERYVVQIHRVTRTPDSVGVWPFPKTRGTSEEVVEVYRQEFDGLDLRAVIFAANGREEA